MVAGGISKELGIDSQIEGVETQIRGVNEQLFGLVSKEAEDAHDLGTDLLGKYEGDEREITELKAEKLPRRLSSDQKDILRERVARFSLKKIFVSCTVGGGEFGETWDFEQDFVHAFDKSVLKLEQQMNCSTIMGPVHMLPLQIEAGSDRQSDATILVNALAEIGVIKNKIAIKPNENRKMLALTIGPKAETDFEVGQREVNKEIVGRLFARHLSAKLAESLKTLPPAKAEIWYRDSDPETFLFASQLRANLKSANWNIAEADLVPVSARRFDGNDLPLFGIEIQNKWWGGMFFGAALKDAASVCKFWRDTGQPCDMRLAALIASLQAPTRKDPSLGEDLYIIIIGPRDPTGHSPEPE
jgi:hypothetical protein